MRRILNHLYHSAAWAYDGVAMLVSLGHWFSWIDSVLPHVVGPRVLEIGFGTGHLLRSLAEAGELHAFGVDESRQMAALARQRSRQAGIGLSALARGLAQRLPFPAERFDSVISTFPSEYAWAPEALREIYRVLKPGGKLVILPAAWLATSRGLGRLAAGIFKAIPGHPAHDPADWIERELGQVLSQQGFEVTNHRTKSGSSLMLIVVATNLT